MAQDLSNSGGEGRNGGGTTLGVVRRVNAKMDKDGACGGGGRKSTRRLSGGNVNVGAKTPPAPASCCGMCGRCFAPRASA